VSVSHRATLLTGDLDFLVELRHGLDVVMFFKRNLSAGIGSWRKIGEMLM
jgi:hypothetical protein